MLILIRINTLDLVLDLIETVIYLLMVQKYIQSKRLKNKTKDSEIVATPLCLGNISKDFKKKTGLNWYVYDFSTDYESIVVDDILDIHKYFMKKNMI